MATKKTKRAKRPPREIWIALGEDNALVTFGTTKRATEQSIAGASSARVVGPYVLAERVRER